MAVETQMRAAMNSSDPIKAIVQHVKKHGSIRNRQCRELLGVSYDETIYILGGLCKVGLLVRKGASSGTHYVLSNSPTSPKAVAEFKDALMKRIL